jgi:hypothetical protein
MDFESLHNQYAVYWPPGPLGDDRKPTFLPADEIKCRWEKTQMEMKDATRANGVWMSRAQVFSTVPLKEAGYLWRGRFSNLVDRLVPQKNRDAARIETVDETPSVDAEEVEYIAYL